MEIYTARLCCIGLPLTSHDSHTFQKYLSLRVTLPVAAQSKAVIGDFR